jgi:ATP-dependent metalloprotease FtsH
MKKYISNIFKFTGFKNKNNSDVQKYYKINPEELLKRITNNIHVYSIFTKLHKFSPKDREKIVKDKRFFHIFYQQWILQHLGEDLQDHDEPWDWGDDVARAVTLLFLIIYGGYVYRYYASKEDSFINNTGNIEFNLGTLMRIHREEFTFNFVKNITEKLADVKGIDNVREEIEEVINMLKRPQAYTDAGAKLIKGILLVGPPGTGKTLLARALAGEANVNFISINAAEFDKSLVGQSDSMIRDLFEKARKNQPCIIFIDEIDSLLHSSRRHSKQAQSSERSVVNTFLAEMDGFRPRDHVFVLGATNSENGLDQAALRPGRFDKIIYVPMPDKKGREDIFKLYLDKIKMPFSEDVTASRLATMTPGFSGAEIESVVNYAVVDAVDNDKPIVTLSDFDNARDRIVLGIKRKFKSQANMRSLLQQAIHEAGHTLICYKDKICKSNIHKVSIAERGKTKGITSTLPDEMEGTKEEFLSRIDMTLGGILAEEMYFGPSKVSMGCGNDLNRSSQLAKAMVMKYAMYNKFGYMVVREEGNTVEHRISEGTRDEIDSSVANIISQRTDIVREILNNNITDLKNLAQKLVEYEELNKDDINNILSGKEIKRDPKRKDFNIYSY